MGAYRSALALGAGVAAFTLAALALGMTTASAGSALRVRTNVPYGHASKLQELDVYPASHGHAPIVILIHGGGWVNGDKSSMRREAQQLQASGIAVLNINYRLGSPAFPMEISDVMTATRWARSHAKSFNGNPDDITLIGGSAGGHLADLATEELNDAGAKLVSGTVALSGPTDFVRLAKDAKHGTFHYAKVVSNALGCHLRSCPKKVEKEWSPSFQVTAHNCPSDGWLLFNSKKEVIPADQADTMAKTLKKLGCPKQKTILPGKAHAMAYWPKVAGTIIKFVLHHQLA